MSVTADLILQSATGHAFIGIGADGRISLWSAGAAALLGWRSEEALGQPASMIFTPEDRAAGRPEAELAEARAAGRTAHERWHLRRDGTRLWAGSETTAIIRDGTLAGYAMIVEDRTRKRQMEDVAQSAGGIGTFEMFPPWGVIRVSRQFCALFGLPEAEEIDSAVVVGLIHPEDRPRILAGHTAEPMEQSEDVEYRILRADTGALRWIARRGRVVRDAALGRSRYLGVCYDITERKLAEQALRAREEELRVLTDTMPVLIAFIDREHRYRYTNRLYETWFAQRIVGRLVREVLGEALHAQRRPLIERAMAGEQVRFEGLVPADGLGLRECHIEYVPRRRANGQIDGVYALTIDITARKEAEEALRTLNEALEARVRERTAALEQAHEALRQSQKMEALGHLTGGIAHDFNNLLQGIIGSLDMLKRRMARGDIASGERFIEGALSSANRAAAVTHRLLAFSRRQPLNPQPVRANPLLAGMEELIHRTLGESIALRLDLDPDLWATRCDRHQLESAILNLAINARDAMPDGGTLSVTTANVVLPAGATPEGVPPGEFVRIAVADTGTGMTPEVQQRAFDPFFTTKPIGAGTGLGLSMIYGFCRQSNGYAQIRSGVGEGTTVSLYLPRHADAGAEEADPLAADGARRQAAGETVLLVEDDPVVRGLVRETLGDLGYRVLEAADGPAGLEVLRSAAAIDLLVTDIGLPGLNGRQMAALARSDRPDLKVLLMTGYADAAEAEGMAGPLTALLPKPFSIDVLAQRIQSLTEPRPAE